MSTLLTIAQRAGDNLFDIENYIARETVSGGPADSDAPGAAGGAI
ncbi:MAG TPA: ferritin, partial [Cryobacterium sp.]|nr:ferritin [Cryobacterium sp.]